MRFVVLTAIWLISTGITVAQTISQETIKFTSKAKVATISGTLKGDNVRDYLIRATKGQVLSVQLKTNNTSAYFNVLPADSSKGIFIGSIEGDTAKLSLPANGNYRIRVYLMRNAARRHESVKYRIDVSLKDAVTSTDSVPLDPFEKKLELLRTECSNRQPSHHSFSA